MRQAQFKGLVINDISPALQITVHSVMSSSQSLADYLRQHGPDKASGLSIKCRTTSGTFDGIVGKLDDLTSGGISYRNLLKGYKPSDYPAAWLDSLPGNHLVVALKPNYGKKIYQYPIKAIKLVVSMANLHYFTQGRTEQQNITNQLKLSPEKRYEIVQTVWQAVQNYFSQQQISVRLLPAYTQKSHPRHFSNATELGFKPDLHFANLSTSINKDTEMLQKLQQNGIFKLTTPTIKVAVVNAIPSESGNKRMIDQLTRLRDQLNKMKVTLKRATDLLHVTDTEPSKQRAQLRQMLKTAIAAKPDVILIYLPQSDQGTHRSDDPSSLYNVAKEITIGAGIASQVVYQKTIENNYADANIIMGILGKTGNIPYVLAVPLPFADVVVGLDIGRRKMNNGGSLNMGAMSRIYLNDGHLLGYNFASGKLLEGETIPPQILENIFPPEEFGGKRVIIHRDGRFPNLELKSLMQWGEDIRAEFYPIEVTKSGTPRMYRQIKGKIDQTGKQSVFYLDEQTAFIVTSPPPAVNNIAKTTAQPLKIHNLSALTLEQALLSVFSLTLLHYGSVRPPRLPVSTHASDKIAGFYLRDIRPDQAKGDKPFWL
jgi:argonaute-like protein implicated in RNA metabolism and viral defense